MEEHLNLITEYPTRPIHQSSFYLCDLASERITVKLVSLMTMFRRIVLTILTGSICGQLLPSQNDVLHQTVQPFLKKWCGDCHSGDEPEADLNLLAALAKAPRGDDLALLLEVRDALRDGDMPPEDEPQPPADAVAKILAWTNQLLKKGEAKVGPGLVTMRRLSRSEYRNTVRDLLGLSRKAVEAATADFPVDDLGYGFDNNGDSLTVSTLHIENYAAAAERLANQAILIEDPDKPTRNTWQLEDHIGNSGTRVEGNGAFFTTERTLAIPIILPRDGLYRIKIRAYSHHGGNEIAELGLKLNDVTKAVFEVANRSTNPGTFFETLQLPGGRHSLGTAFLNDFFDRKAAKRGDKDADRNLWIDYTVKVRYPIKYFVKL